VWVLFARDILFHEMLRKPFTGSLGLGTVCKSVIYAKRAIDGQSGHGRVSDWFEPLN
jgi:hypothetical protein